MKITFGKVTVMWNCWAIGAGFALPPVNDAQDPLGPQGGKISLFVGPFYFCWRFKS